MGKTYKTKDFPQNNDQQTHMERGIIKLNIHDVLSMIEITI